MPTEADAIAAVERPATVASLTNDLRALGVEEGDVMIVHSSLSSLGWVAGGAQAVVEALLASVGPSGTVVMPTHSGQLSDPVGWGAPPVPAGWIDVIRDGFPAYDADLTPTRSMGAIVEAFRHARATVRSDHPLTSFAANGPHAEAIVADHELGSDLGERSPLARLYDLHASILLLGVDHGNDTSLHLAEHRADWPGKTTEQRGAPVRGADGSTCWTTWVGLAANESDFAELGESFAETGAERSGPVGGGVGRLCSQRAIVDFAAGWIEANRPSSA